jgi:hypothetical protein
MIRFEESVEFAIQQEEGDNRPDVAAMPVLLVIARLEGSVIIVVAVVLPAHGDAGVGTIICGLRPDAPASVAADGMVASLYDPPVMVARPGIGAISVLLKNSVRF